MNISRKLILNPINKIIKPTEQIRLIIMDRTEFSPNSFSKKLDFDLDAIKENLLYVYKKLQNIPLTVDKASFVDCEHVLKYKELSKCNASKEGNALSRNEQKFEGARKHEVFDNLTSKLALKNAYLAYGLESMNPKEYDNYFKSYSKSVLKTLNRYKFFIKEGLDKNIAQPKRIFNLSLGFAKNEAEANGVKLDIKNLELLDKYKKGLYYSSNSNAKERINDFDLYFIFSNLAQNACKYTKKGSNVGIDFAEEILDGKKYLTYSIKDRGIGVPADEVSKIFGGERATNAINSGKQGSGYGLAQIKKIIELEIGGKLELKTPLHPNDIEFPGSEFKCYLPVA